MELVINGSKLELEVHTIQDVIEHYGLVGKPIVVEVDGIIFTTEQWVNTVVRSHMQIELVHFVGGG